MTLPAHEDSGTVISSLDDDLVDFLKKLFSTEDNVFLFILADHGPRYGNWKKTLDGREEHKLPALFFIGPTAFLSKVPGSLAMLSYNTRRLVSKVDLFMTLQHITLLPYYQNFERYSAQDIKWRAGRYLMFDLLSEKIEDKRTCNDAGIDKFLCSCNKYLTIELESLDPSQIDFLTTLAKAAINDINQESQTNFNYEGRKICSTVSLKEIKKVKIFKFSRCKHAYQLIISTQEFPSVLIESEVLALCSRKMRKPGRFFYDHRHLYLNGKIMIKVEYVKRLDENPCKSLALAHLISPGVCFCKSTSHLGSLS